MATPFYLEAPQGEEAPKPSFLDRVGTGLGNLWTNAPPEAFFSLAEAMARPGGPFASKLAMGLSGFGRQMGESQKRKGLASAFDSMAAEIPESQRPIFQQMVQNNPEALMQGYAGQLFSKPAEQPSGVKEYLFAVSNDGYKGTFTDFQKEQKRAGAPSTTVNVGGEKAFEKSVGEFQGKLFGDLATGGMDANAQLSQINELESNLAQTPGGIQGGLQSLATSWGLPIGKNADATIAANAIIAKLVPAQRGPGTGPMSDKDIDLFKASLPSLVNTPGGNAIIVGTMKAMAQYKMDQARIAAAAMNGQISRQQAQESLMNLPDPMAQFKARKAGTTVTPGPRKVLKFNPATGTTE